ATEDILKDGMLLFFSIALVASITVDYHLSESKYPKYTNFYMMVLFPFVLWVGAVATYFILAKRGVTADNTAALRLEILITAASCVYAAVHKAVRITQAE